MTEIVFTGDLLCYPKMTEKFGPDYDGLFSEFKKPAGCDYLVGNLESPIAGEERYGEVREVYDL